MVHSLWRGVEGVDKRCGFRLEGCARRQRTERCLLSDPADFNRVGLGNYTLIATLSVF